MKQKLTILLTILFIGFVVLGIHDLRDNQVKLQLKEIKLQDTVIELNKLKLEKDNLNSEFEKAINEGKVNEEKAKQLEQEKLQLEQRTKELEQQLQAKRNTNNTSQVIAGATSRSNVTGDKQSWLAASGIPENEWWAVDWIVSKESSWNPNAVNSSSGACGLVQSLPCSKLGPNWNDPVTALKWQYQYVTARYGGYSQAVSFWKANGWY